MPETIAELKYVLDVFNEAATGLYFPPDAVAKITEALNAALDAANKAMSQSRSPAD